LRIRGYPIKLVFFNERDTTILEGGVDEASFGGYVGAEVYLDESCSLYGEYMLADDAWAFGTWIVWKF